MKKSFNAARRAKSAGVCTNKSRGNGADSVWRIWISFSVVRRPQRMTTRRSTSESEVAAP